MADYQMGGGYIEGETPEEYQRRMEEERRRQEALQSPVTQKIVTNADGTQEVTVKGTPEALSSANPNTPTLMQPGQPVAPDESAAETQRLQRQAQSATGVPVAPQGMGARLGQAVSQAGTNFVNNVQNAPQNFANNLSRGMTNIQNAPENFVRNVGQMSQQQLAAAQQAPGSGSSVAPVAPDSTAAYNARIARLESGSNPNIGYHDRSKGTAFGLYGLTDAAYADARRRDPSLPADKTKATPEQQTAAMNGYTAGNAQQLQQFGITPTPANLATAHLLGATGLKRFQDTGYLSPQAIAQNGGEANLRKIIAQRQAGTGGPASGAAMDTAALTYRHPSETPGDGRGAYTSVDTTGEPVTGRVAVSPYAMPTTNGLGLKVPGVDVNQPSATASAIDRYQSVQNNPDELMKFAFSSDTNTPDFLKQRAKDQIAEGYSQQKNLTNAQKEIGNLSPKQAADAIQGRGKAGVGDWMQYLLLKHVGLSDLANQKGEELGIGHKWTQSTILDDAGNNVAVEIQTTASGKLLSGNRMDGTPLTKAELNQSGASLGKGTSLSAEVYVDPATGKRYRSGYDSSGKSAYVSMSGGPAFKGDEKRLVVQSVGTAAQKAENAAAIGLRYAAPLAFNKASAGAAGKFSQENDVRVAYPTETPGAPLTDLNTGKAVVPDSNGNFTLKKNDGSMVTVAAGGGAVETAKPADETKSKQTPLPEAPKFKEPGFENESQSTFEARKKAWTETYKDQYKAQQEDIKLARGLLPEIKNMKKLIDQGTSSGVGTIVDKAGNFFGYSTDGATAIAAIKPLADKVLKSVERFQGPQSDKDVDSYKAAAGDLANPEIPAAQKQAAFNTIIEIMKRRAPDLDWDSALGTGGKAGSGTTASGNKFKKVQ